ncbi:hypothetical protein [Paenibacillus ferrarius]|uniref:hypothetical protein n=1 Tax=Paenibacillus ferrarius TaxID=1469647 RepID=UPI003D268FED
MIQNIEIVMIAVFVLGIMLSMCLDIFKRNKSVVQSAYLRAMQQPAVQRDQRAAQPKKEQPVTAPPVPPAPAAVYPMYVDCSQPSALAGNPGVSSQA